MRKENIKRLEAFEMWIYGVGWKESAGWNPGPMKRYLKWLEKKGYSIEKV